MTKVFKNEKNGHFYFFCPGCNTDHEFNETWLFDGNMESPTISPSLKVTWHTKLPDIPDKVCHSFVREGKIQFLSDCTHKLAGQTVPLPDWEPKWD